jgi:hypothetical protein
MGIQAVFLMLFLIDLTGFFSQPDADLLNLLQKMKTTKAGFKKFALALIFLAGLACFGVSCSGIEYSHRHDHGHDHWETKGR